MTVSSYTNPEKKQETEYNDWLKDASEYPDMQELIIATDMFITDYSSAIFDFSLLSRPAFIYASDYAIYEESER